ncbi:MAG: MATE family efflux transporter [Turicibacter sp.]|nr:MATE family efflux transporter [Turicibacter sp.]
MKTESLDPMYYLESAPVPKAIRHMAVPMVLAMVANMIYNVTDAYFIGRLQDTSAMAAITLALPFTTVIMALGDLFGTGGSTYLSRLLGEKDVDGVKHASSVNFYLCLIFGGLFALLSLFFMNPILHLLGATGETAAPTRDYLLPFIVGAPFMVANFTLGQTVRGEGAAKESMMGMLLSVALNIVLDPLLIFTFGMGLEGAALATVLGNLGAVAYYSWYLHKKSPAQSVSIRDFKPTKAIFSNIFKIGISAFLLACFMTVSSLLFNQFSMAYGDHVVAAFGIAFRLCQISDFVGMGLYMGVVPLIAFSYAGGASGRLMAVLKTTAVYLVGLTVGIAAVIFIFRNVLLGAFSSDREVLFVGREMLTALLVATLFAGLSGLLTSMFQAFGQGMESGIMSLFRGIAMIPILLIGSHYFGLAGIIWAMPTSDFLATVVGLVIWLATKSKIMAVPVGEREAFEQ